MKQKEIIIEQVEKEIVIELIFLYLQDELKKKQNQVEVNMYFGIRKVRLNHKLDRRNKGIDKNIRNRKDIEGLD